jgi:hypothetical protein
MSNEAYLKRVLKFFIWVTLVTASIIAIFANWQVGLAFGALLGFFTSFHLGRAMTPETFEINASNKDKRRGLSWYEKEVMAHMHDLRYQLVSNQEHLKVWQPSPWARVMGGEFKMELTPYSITLTGPRGAVRIMKSILDIDKIFL